MLVSGYYGLLNWIGSKATFSCIYLVDYDKTYVFIDGKLNRIPPLDEFETCLEYISEEKALEFLGITEVEYNEEQCKAYNDRLKAELKVQRKAIKQRKCYERHLKNFEKKKKR